MMFVSITVLGVVFLTLALLFRPSLSQSSHWRAVVTPLASIIGSGFLVLGPILNTSFGKYAPLAMMLLCAIAYGFGHAVRFNIAHIDRQPFRTSMEHILENVSSWVLAFAYIISVAYYLNLFGSFAVSLTTMNDPGHSRLVTSIVFVFILAVGWGLGFSAMERLEQVSVSIKLAIITGLLAGLTLYFFKQTQAGMLRLEIPTKSGWPALTLLFGLIVTVQGFETSRYLGHKYDAAIRIKSMKLAQHISGIIYIAYIVLLTYAFNSAAFDLNETAIIEMMSMVAPVLPLLLVVAALSAQFSAAVADTSGAGGLLNELSGKKISERSAYLILVCIGIIFTWTINLYDIIVYASKAFALYYALQTLIALSSAVRKKEPPATVCLFTSLACLGFLIVLFGDSVE